MELAEIIRYASFAWFAFASIGGNLYLINLIRRYFRRDHMQRVQVLQTAEARNTPVWRVPVQPAPRRD